MIVAIHQPNFFPWLGYFNKITASDAFILLDHVQFPKTAGSWINRVKLLTSGEGRWCTAQVNRNYHGTKSIKEMEFAQLAPWRTKMVNTLSLNYKKSSFYNEVFPFFKELIENPENNIAEYNIHAITSIARELGIPETKLYRSSNMLQDGNSNELLVALTQQLGGSTYLCGGGAGGYQEESIFTQAGIELRYQHFQHPVYEQASVLAFIPGLSIIDAVMNRGWDGAKELIK